MHIYLIIFAKINDVTRSAAVQLERQLAIARPVFGDFFLFLFGTDCHLA